VSVIVPVYNAAEYLSRCMESILNQRLRDIEIIAVDDASTDASVDMLTRYAAADGRVRVVRHEHNEGLHVARISGVLASRGRYLAYVDADDCVSLDMFDVMHRHALEQQADVVRGGAWVLRAGDECPPQDGNARMVLKFVDQTYASGVDYLESDFYPPMWLHLHHRRLWDLALPHFPRVRLLGEDNLTSFVLAFYAGRVVSLSHVGYCYIERDDSLSGDGSFANVARHIEHRGTILKLLRAIVDAGGGKAERCWGRIRSDNVGLLLSYIDALPNAADRVAAQQLFEAHWGEFPRPGRPSTPTAQ
jgi:hypothetical protein